MKKNNGQDKVYSTLDSFQSGFLTLKGHTPRFENQNGKIVFVFALTDTLTKDLQDYNNGAIVEASKFTFAVKTLKSQIHSMRKEKDYDPFKTRHHQNI